jgi:hypothetical protein
MLTERDRELLDFESSYTGPPLRKLDDVRRRFGVTGARYIQPIQNLCKRAEVESDYPQLVHRTIERLDRQRLQRDAKLQLLD